MRALRTLLTAAVLMLIFSAASAPAQTITVSGDLRNILSGNIAGVSGQTFVRFRLKNWSGNIPRVNGIGIMANIQVDALPDGTGHFSTPLYGNDSLTPANTLYEVQFWQNGRLVTAGLYNFTAANCPSGCNLDTFAQLNPAPNPAISIAPFLGTNNTFTGTNTFNGAVQFNSTVGFTGATAFSQPIFSSPITINTANQYTWNFTNPAAARSISWPDPGGNDTVTFLNAAQALANKTLTSPTSTGTDAGTETLQNKTLGSGTAPASPWPTSQGGTGQNSTATFPTSGVVDTTTATTTLQNKTLNGANSGNAVTLLNVQYIQGNLTGNATDQNLFSYTLPANTLQAGKGLRLTLAALHASGTASVSYKIKFGATTINSASTATAGSDVILSALVFNNSGVQNAQTAIGQPAFIGNTFLGGSGASLPAENTANAVTITGTFNVAATDQVRPTLFIVELIQ